MGPDINDGNDGRHIPKMALKDQGLRSIVQRSEISVSNIQYEGVAEGNLLNSHFRRELEPDAVHGILSAWYLRLFLQVTDALL